MIKLFLLHLFLSKWQLIPEKRCYDPGEVFFLKTNEKMVVIGDISIIPVRSGKDFNLFIIGADLFEKKIKLYLPKSRKAINLNVCEKKFPVKKYYFPKELVELNPEDLRRAEEEKKKLDKIWQTIRKESYFDGSFSIPVTGAINFNFGERRFMNEEERSPHTGIDIHTEEGTPVMASGRGIAVFVGNTFFGGNSVVLDHGAGIYTMYFHLKEILIKEGEMVERGRIIGRVGKTGRATGPHLHWGLRVAGRRADPISFLELLKKFGGNL